MRMSCLEVVRAVALIAAVGVLPTVLAGCSAGSVGGTKTSTSGATASVASSSATSLRTGSPPQFGSLTGKVGLYGGPLASNGRMALNGEGAPGQAVTARSGTGSLTVTTDAAGIYRLSLGVGVWPVSGCGRTIRVVVAAGIEAHQDFARPVP